MNAACHAGIAVLGNAVEKACFLLAGIVVARHLGADQYGVYTFSTSFSYLFAVLSDSGLRTVLTREVARSPERSEDYLGAVLGLKVLLTLVSLILVTVVVKVTSIRADRAYPVYIALFANLLWFGATPTYSIFRGFGRMAYEGFLVAFLGVASLALTIAAVHFGADATQILWASVGSHALMVCLAYLLVARCVAIPKIRLRWSDCRTLGIEAVPIGLALFLGIAYSSAGTITLEALRGSRSVGLFNATTKLARNLNAFPLVVSGVLLPTFTRRASSQQVDLAFSYRRALRLMALIGLPLATGGFVLADWVIAAVYGDDYAAAVPALRIAIWSLPLYYLSYVSKTLLEALNQQLLWMIALAVGVALNLVLNIALVPNMGTLGASLALVLADMTILIGSFYFVSRKVPDGVTQAATDIAKALLCAIILGMVMHLLNNRDPMIAITAGLAAYMLSAALSGLVNRDDWTILAQATHWVRKGRR